MLGGLKNEQALKGYQVVHFQPFDPVHKRTEATVKGAGRKDVQGDQGRAAGDPGAVGQRRQSEGRRRQGGRRVRGARLSLPGRGAGRRRRPWQFLGVLPLFDPPREDAKATIATARQMGVKVKMVTGDALAIARETAKKLGMGTNILDASSLGDAKHQETAAVAEAIEKADGFAQVFPEHKFHIVDVLQKRGHIVGMTGDGVNDAPALKKADCGIAVSGATDAARAAASIVLMTPGLSVIIDAIKESRQIFQRMNSYAIYRIAETLRVLLFMTLAILVFNFYPADRGDDRDAGAAQRRRHPVHRLRQRSLQGRSPRPGTCAWCWGSPRCSASSASSPRSACSISASASSTSTVAHIQTLMYLKLSVAGHLTIFLTRTRGPFWSIRPARILWMAVLGTQTLATLIAVYGLFMTPLGWGWALFVWGYALAWFLVNDRVKLLAYRIFNSAEGDCSSAAKPGLRPAPSAG